jgi:hypothetical protein
LYFSHYPHHLGEYILFLFLDNHHNTICTANTKKYGSNGEWKFSWGCMC